MLEKHVQNFCVYDEQKSQEKGEKFDSDKVKRILGLLVETKKATRAPGGKDFRAFLKA